MSAEGQKQQKSAIERADEELLASLGYKQEFQRAFTGLEVGCSCVSTAVRSGSGIAPRAWGNMLGFEPSFALTIAIRHLESPSVSLVSCLPLREYASLSRRH